MPGKARRCKLFDYCPLKIVYEMRGEKDLIKKYCNGKFRDCGRYKLEALGQNKIFGMPKKIKVRKKKN